MPTITTGRKQLEALGLRKLAGSVARAIKQLGAREILVDKTAARILVHLDAEQITGSFSSLEDFLNSDMLQEIETATVSGRKKAGVRIRSLECQKIVFMVGNKVNWPLFHDFVIVNLHENDPEVDPWKGSSTTAFNDESSYSTAKPTSRRKGSE